MKIEGKFFQVFKPRIEASTKRFLKKDLKLFMFLVLKLETHQIKSKQSVEHLELAINAFSKNDVEMIFFKFFD